MFTMHDIDLIFALAEERRRLREQLEQLSNAKIAEKFETTDKTIKKILNGDIPYHALNSAQTD